MERYDYRQAMKEDILQYIKDNDVLETYEYSNGNELHEKLNEELWAEDSVTGNGANFYDTPEHCEEYVGDNLRLLLEALRDFGQELKDLPNDDDKLFQFADCTIRCYLLWWTVWDALKELGFEEEY